MTANETVVVVLDVAPSSWATRPPDELKTTVECVLAFCRAVLFASPGSTVAIVAAHPTRASFLFRAEQDGRDVDVRRQVLSALPVLLADSSLPCAPPSLAAALSRALCHIHATAQLRKFGPQQRGRVVCVHASPDDSAQYVAVMNAVFAAQRCSAVIDSCVVAQSDSPLLQQATHITQGVYARHDSSEPGLLQCMLCCFVPSAAARASSLAMPGIPVVDSRASCFCHKRPLELGFVCSVCLSVFCRFCAVCPTCGSRFWLPSVERSPQLTPPPSR
jgi:transcription initiation factor TFIIH subunit 3